MNEEITRKLDEWDRKLRCSHPCYHEISLDEELALVAALRRALVDVYYIADSPDAKHGGFSAAAINAANQCERDIARILDCDVPYPLPDGRTK